MQDEMLLTTSEAAAQLGIHPDTLRRWADKGDVPMFRLPNGNRMFRPSDIERVAHKLNEKRAQALTLWNPPPGTNRRQGLRKRSGEPPRQVE
jgi:excisionase family DNA binding protein